MQLYVYLPFLDIYGLLLFLTVHPYNTKLWWKRAVLDHLLFGNHKPLFNLTSKIMWRTMKADVEDQIGVPKQTEYLTFLTFSAVEQHFYKKEQSKCSERTQTQIEKHFAGRENITLSELSKSSLTSLLSPLLSLRQACCHPAVVRNSFLSLGKSCVTMEELLKKLMDNATLETEEAQRKLLRALNGLAGIAILEQKYEIACSIYSDTISTWGKYKQLKADSLQVKFMYFYFELQLF